MAGKVGFHFTDNVNIESQTAEGNHFNSRQYITDACHCYVIIFFHAKWRRLSDGRTVIAQNVSSLRNDLSFC